MLVRIIKEGGYTGRITRERIWRQGDVVDVPSHSASVLLREGAAVMAFDRAIPLVPPPVTPYVPLVGTPDTHRVVAVMTTYNDADCIEYVVRRALAQGIDVFVLDNWSDDGTWEILQRMDDPRLLAVERYPDEPSDEFDFASLHPTLHSIWSRYPDCWHMWHASDESVCSPWHGVPYRDAVWIAEQAGYNCINHHYLDFHPTVTAQLDPGDDPVQSLLYYEVRSMDLQRTWKAPVPVQLHLVGHEVEFPGRRIHPVKFILKNYRFRSSAQAKQKLRERQHRLRRSLPIHGHAQPYYTDNAETLIKIETGLLAWHDDDWLTDPPVPAVRAQPTIIDEDTNGNHESREAPPTGMGTEGSDPPRQTVRRTGNRRRGTDGGH